MSMIFQVEGEGESAAADVTACHKVMTTLQRYYPDHPWMIGSDLFAGVIHARLMYNGSRPDDNKGYGFLLHLATVEGPGADEKIMRMGGECLERFNLKRDAANAESAVRAQDNGLNLDNIVTKSRH